MKRKLSNIQWLVTCILRGGLICVILGIIYTLIVSLLFGLQFINLEHIGDTVTAIGAMGFLAFICGIGLATNFYIYYGLISGLAAGAITLLFRKQLTFKKSLLVGSVSGIASALLTHTILLTLVLIDRKNISFSSEDNSIYLLFVGFPSLFVILGTTFLGWWMWHDFGQTYSAITETI